MLASIVSVEVGSLGPFLFIDGIWRNGPASKEGCNLIIVVPLVYAAFVLFPITRVFTSGHSKFRRTNHTAAGYIYTYQSFYIIHH